MRISDWSADGCSSDLRESAHRTARLIGVFQPVEEHMVVCGVVPDARAAAMLLEQIGRIGHRFHAARDDQVDAARRERLGAHDHRLHTRTANLVDGRRLPRRSEERRVGKEWVSTGTSRWATIYKKKNKK